MSYFNVRVYGLLILENKLLVSDEEIDGYQFTKLPGGGVELGEGLKEALKREFLEECNLKINVQKHFYTTDFYIKSAFNNSQVISIYYKVINIEDISFALKTIAYDFDELDLNHFQSFRMIDIDQLKADDMTFPADRHVIRLLKGEITE